MGNVSVLLSLTRTIYVVEFLLKQRNTGLTNASVTLFATVYAWNVDAQTKLLNIET